MKGWHFIACDGAAHKGRQKLEAQCSRCAPHWARILTRSTIETAKAHRAHLAELGTDGREAFARAQELAGAALRASETPKVAPTPKVTKARPARARDEVLSMRIGAGW